MTRNPPSLPSDPFGRTGNRAATLDRRARVAMLLKAAALLLESGTAEGLFVGGALQSWLAEGGSLERDFLKVTPPKGSHRSVQHVAAQVAGFKDG